MKHRIKQISWWVPWPVNGVTQCYRYITVGNKKNWKQLVFNSNFIMLYRHRCVEASCEQGKPQRTKENPNGPGKTPTRHLGTRNVFMNRWIDSKKQVSDFIGWSLSSETPQSITATPHAAHPLPGLASREQVESKQRANFAIKGWHHLLADH